VAANAFPFPAVAVRDAILTRDEKGCRMTRNASLGSLRDPAAWSPIAATPSAATVGSQLAELRGRAPGFDGMRLWLSLSIIVYHSMLTSYGPAYDGDVVEGPARPLVLVLLPAFFALSGFLIAGSMLRVRSLKIFLAHRILRIIPALFCEVLISALVLGPLLTTLPLSDYFRDPLFAKYFLNIIGEIQYVLPGLFPDNPLPSIVNIQLWTIPVELKCYLLFSVLMLAGVSLNKHLMLLLFIAGMLVLGALQWTGHHVQDPRDVVSDHVLILNFIGGITAYLWRDTLRLSLPALAVSVVAASLVFWSNRFIALSPILTIYLMVFVGMTRVPMPRLLAKGDYSYGVYLYGFPIQQTIAYLFPEHRTPLFNLMLAIPLTLTMAVLSWHLLEKHVLDLKRHIKAPVRREPVPQPAYTAVNEA
jgi:peptidoglycan/LPS O-acetylase OafA/YrhL